MRGGFPPRRTGDGRGKPLPNSVTDALEVQTWV
jgi:hypothetical protein